MRLTALFIAILLPASVFSETVKIGLIAPLTGPMSFLGQGNRTGALLAAEAANAKGGAAGRQIQIVVEDSQAEPRIGLAAFNKLADVDHIIASLVTLTSVSMAVRPVAEEEKVLIIAESNHPDLVKGFHYTIRNLYSMTTLTDEFVTFARDRGYTRIGMLHADEEWGENGRRELVKKTAGGPLEVVAHESFLKSATDVMSQVVRLKAESPDVIYVLGIGPAAAMAYKQIRHGGIKAPIVGYEMCGQPDVLESVKNSPGPIFSIDAEYDTQSAEYRNLLDLFQKRFPGQPLELEVMQAFDSVSILLDAMRSGASTSTEIRDAIVRKGKFHGTVGWIEFTPEGDSIWKMRIAPVEAGRCRDR